MTIEPCACCAWCWAVGMVARLRVQPCSCAHLNFYRMEALQALIQAPPSLPPPHSTTAATNHPHHRHKPPLPPQTTPPPPPQTTASASSAHHRNHISRRAGRGPCSQGGAGSHAGGRGGWGEWHQAQGGACSWGAVGAGVLLGPQASSWGLRQALGASGKGQGASTCLLLSHAALFRQPRGWAPRHTRAAR